MRLIENLIEKIKYIIIITVKRLQKNVSKKK